MRFTLALLALVALAPAAHAWGPFSDAIEIPMPRVGDSYAYRQEIHVEGVERPGTWVTEPYEGAGQVVIDVLGPSTAVDAHGRARPSEAYRIRQAHGTTLVRDETCHAHPGTASAIRRDFAASTPDYSWSDETGVVVAQQHLAGSTVRKDWAPVVRFDGRDCEGAPVRESGKVAVGSTYGVSTAPFAYGVGLWGHYRHAAAPAAATTYEGRDALVFQYDAADLAPFEGAEGFVRVTLADGLALPVRVETDLTIEYDEGERRVSSMSELVGLEAGDGIEIGRGSGTGWLGHPQEDVAPYDPLRIDDAALGFPLAFDEAFDAAMADPSQDVAGWLAQHPRAVLAIAIYERHLDGARGTILGGAASTPERTDGGWYLGFQDGNDAKRVVVYRATGVDTAGGAFALPQKITHVLPTSGSLARLPDTPPAQRATSAAISARLTQVGMHPEQVESFVWILSGYGAYASISVFVSDVPYMNAPEETSGRFVTIEGVNGELFSLATTTYSTGELGILPQGGVAREEGLATTLAGPQGGIAMGTIGLAVILLAIKLLLVPLFTRLRRDRLLDNPVRARLYEVVRAEPGIHLAGLIEASGTGESATRHHVDTLVRQGFLVQIELQGKRRFHAAGEVAPIDARHAGLLRPAKTRAVYDLYASEPALSLREAARRVGLSAPSVHRIRKRLEREGLLPAAPEASVVQLRSKGH